MLRYAVLYPLLSPASLLQQLWLRPYPAPLLQPIAFRRVLGLLNRDYASFQQQVQREKDRQTCRETLTYRERERGRQTYMQREREKVVRVCPLTLSPSLSSSGISSLWHILPLPCRTHTTCCSSCWTPCTRT